MVKQKMIHKYVRENITFIALFSATLFFLLQIYIYFTQSFFFLLDIIKLLFLSWLIYFILTPIVSFFEKRKFSRLLTVILIYLFLSLLLIIFGILIVPIISNQLILFGVNLPSYIEDGVRHIRSIANFLNFTDTVKLDSFINQLSESLVQITSNLISNWLTILSATINIMFTILLILIISSMMLVDDKRIITYIKEFIPIQYHDEIRYLQRRINKSFGGFLRGQLILGLSFGVFNWIILTIFGVPFALITSIVAFFFMIIPFFNGFTAFLPGIIITAITQPQALLIVAILLLVINAIEFNIIANLIMAETVGLHPIVIILSIIIGARVQGIFGAIFAIPIAGVLSLIPEHYRQRRKSS